MSDDEFTTKRLEKEAKAFKKFQLASQAQWKIDTELGLTDASYIIWRARQVSQAIADADAKALTKVLAQRDEEKK